MIEENSDYYWREDSGTGRYDPEIPRRPLKKQAVALDLEKSKELAQIILNARDILGQKHFGELLDVLSYWNENYDSYGEFEGGMIERLRYDIRSAPFVHLILFKEKHNF